MRNRTKNYNMNPTHRKAVFNNMLKSFQEKGFVETTLAKAKGLKQYIEKNSDEKVKILKIGVRQGDGAQVGRVVSVNYLENKFNKKSK